MIAILVAAALSAWTRPPQVEPQTWRFQTDPLAWVHERAGIVMPLNVGQFGIGKRTSLNAAGTDEEAIYQAGDGREATVYVFRPAMPLAPSLLTLIERSIMRMRGSEGLDWTESELSLGGAAPEAVRAVAIGSYRDKIRATGIGVARYGSWIVAVRLTGDAQAAPAISAGLEELLRAVHPARAADPLSLQRIAPCKPGRPNLTTAHPVTADATTIMSDVIPYSSIMAVDATPPSGGLVADTAVRDLCLAPTPKGLPVLTLRAKPSTPPRAVMLMGDSGFVMDISRSTATKPGVPAPFHVVWAGAASAGVVQHFDAVPGDAQLVQLLGTVPYAAPLAAAGYDSQRGVVVNIAPETISR